MFSGLILIGRGLDRRGKRAWKEKRDYYPVLNVLEDIQRERSGSDSMMDTPVPIPNTEVKHHNGDDSTLCENSKLPVLFFYFLLVYKIFLFKKSRYNQYNLILIIFILKK